MASARWFWPLHRSRKQCDRPGYSAPRARRLPCSFKASLGSMRLISGYYVCGLTFFPSVVTPKPANGGQGKTGQREEAGDTVVLPCNFLCRQVHFRTPTPRTTFEYMTMMEKAIEHGSDSGAISQ